VPATTASRTSSTPATIFVRLLMATSRDPGEVIASGQP
jgi:hypothetical protein